MINYNIAPAHMNKYAYKIVEVKISNPDKVESKLPPVWVKSWQVLSKYFGTLTLLLL